MLRLTLSVLALFYSVSSVNAKTLMGPATVVDSDTIKIGSGPLHHPRTLALIYAYVPDDFFANPEAIAEQILHLRHCSFSRRGSR